MRSLLLYFYYLKLFSKYTINFAQVLSYRLGRGSTSQILGMNDKRDRLVGKIIDAEIKQDEAVRERMAVDWLDKV